MPEATVIYTGLYDKPAFTEGRANLVYMGAMTENQQELAIQALKPYKKKNWKSKSRLEQYFSLPGMQSRSLNSTLRMKMEVE